MIREKLKLNCTLNQYFILSFYFKFDPFIITLFDFCSIIYTNLNKKIQLILKLHIFSFLKL